MKELKRENKNLKEKIKEIEKDKGILDEKIRTMEANMTKLQGKCKKLEYQKAELIKLLTLNGVTEEEIRETLSKGDGKTKQTICTRYSILE